MPVAAKWYVMAARRSPVVLSPERWMRWLSNSSTSPGAMTMGSAVLVSRSAIST